MTLWRKLSLGLLGMTMAACSAPAPNPTTQITVFAAASLHKVFAELGHEFERQHQDVHVNFNFAGSPTLVTQLDQGATADVLATADEATMHRAQEAQLLSESQIFASNHLVIVTDIDNATHISRLTDLLNPALTVVVCAPQVPCGALARQVQQRAGIVIPAKSEEQSVTDVLTKVTSGEADAGLVYATDVKTVEKKAHAVALPEADSLATRYPIGVLTHAHTPDTAKQFIDFVRSEQGNVVLRNAGFGAP